MYLCLASGLDMDQSLDMAVRLVNHPKVLEQIDVLRRDTAGGQSFSEAIGHAQIFPGIYNRMLAIGSRAGVSDEVMKQISEGCLENIEDSLDRIVSRLEPTLVAGTVRFRGNDPAVRHAASDGHHDQSGITPEQGRPTDEPI